MRNIEDFVYRNFDQVISYGGGTDLRVDCPFCTTRTGSDDIKQHLYVSLSKETCHCFRCEYSKSWLGLVMDTTGMDYAHALGEIYAVPNPVDFEGLKERLKDEREFKEEYPDLPADFTLLKQGITKRIDSATLIGRALYYLRIRGFKPEVYEKYGLGVASSVGYRVIIPIEDNYWQARSLYGFLKPKYINPEGESRELLFNSRALDLYNEVVICEGAFSSMAVGDNSVALVGKNPTDEKLDRLRMSEVEHFIVTIEEGAQRSMVTLADALKGFGKRVTVWLYDHGDPADSTAYKEKPYDLRTKLEILFDGTLKD